jgi:oligoendopeptidase F
MNMEQTWDLHRVFNGGSKSSDLRISMDRLQCNLENVNGLSINETSITEFIELVLHTQELYKDWYQLYEYTICLISINTLDEEAMSLMKEVDSLSALYQTCESKINKKLLLLDEEEWCALMHDPKIKVISPILMMRRDSQKSRAGQDIERTVSTLEGDGMHAWGDLYQIALGNIKVTIGEEILPASSVAQKIYNSPNQEEKKVVFEKWKSEWEREGKFCAKALNHMAGFRLKTYELRGWDSFLQESLEVNRIQIESIQSMWDSLMKNKAPFLQFLNRKKWLNNSVQICWTDQFSPLSNKGPSTIITYEEGANLIVESLRLFDNNMADFIENVFLNQWIDATVQPNKGLGAFCAPLPNNKESRIMISYNNDLQSVGVLAHELGHAYHYRLLQDLPMYLQDCPQIMAEISSTLTETIVMKAALKKSVNPLEKLEILNHLICRDIGTLLNSYVRHLFEVRFYEKRKKKTLSPDELSDLMLNAQMEVFDSCLDTYEPTFWASLRHFYFTRKPFGHYPYSIAHLLSTGIYNQIKDEQNRGKRLRNLLLDTSRLTVEQLVSIHLGEDISNPNFWEGALEIIFENISDFMEISEEYIN